MAIGSPSRGVAGTPSARSPGAVLGKQRPSLSPHFDYLSRISSRRNSSGLSLAAIGAPIGQYRRSGCAPAHSHAAIRSRDVRSCPVADSGCFPDRRETSHPRGKSAARKGEIPFELLDRLGRPALRVSQEGWRVVLLIEGRTRETAVAHYAEDKSHCVTASIRR